MFNEYVINLINNEFKDTTTNYNISISENEKLFTSEISGSRSMSLQVIWQDLTGTIDCVFELYFSNDNITYTIYPDSNMYPVTSNSSDMWIKDIWNARFIGVKFIRNNVTGGKIKMLLNCKL
jgi:hypothetical protein